MNEAAWLKSWELAVQWLEGVYFSNPSEAQSSLQLWQAYFYQKLCDKPKETE